MGIAVSLGLSKESGWLPNWGGEWLSARLCCPISRHLQADVNCYPFLRKCLALGKDKGDGEVLGFQVNLQAGLGLR